MAIRAAKYKADYLLEAIGHKTGSALEIREINMTPYDKAMLSNVRGARNEETIFFVDGIQVEGEPEFEVQFKNILLKSSIFVKFEIEKPMVPVEG